jgi:hypothetical protein
MRTTTRTLSSEAPPSPPAARPVRRDALSAPPGPRLLDRGCALMGRGFGEAEPREAGGEEGPSPLLVLRCPVAALLPFARPGEPVVRAGDCDTRFGAGEPGGRCSEPGGRPRGGEDEPGIPDKTSSVYFSLSPWLPQTRQRRSFVKDELLQHSAVPPRRPEHHHGGRNGHRR